MKSIFVFLFIFFHLFLFGQRGINFQGVAKNSGNINYASQYISLRLSIISNTINGQVEYSETKKVFTNENGLFSIVIGDTNSNVIFGNYSNINWKNQPKFLKVEFDPNSNIDYILMGIIQLQSVPYSLYSYSVDVSGINGILPVSSGGTGSADLNTLSNKLGIPMLKIKSDSTNKTFEDLSNRIDNKLNKTDTLSLSNRIDNKLNKTDTLSLSSRVDNKLNKTDTLSLSSRIDNKSNISSTFFKDSVRINKSLIGSNTSESNFYGFTSKVVQISGIKYELNNLDNGKILVFNSSNNILVSMPLNLPIGYNCLMVQKGTGAIICTPNNGVTLQSRFNYFKSAGVNSILTLLSIETNFIIISGDLTN